MIESHELTKTIEIFITTELITLPPLAKKHIPRV
jgi:hypothetical protein